LELGDGVAALRGNLPYLGELVFEKQGLVGQGDDLGFLGHGCLLHRRVRVLEVGELFMESEESGSESTEVDV
jgi:hypothetical protein